jgi:hypothetical protein
MRTSFLSQAKDKLNDALKAELTAEQWKELAKDILCDINNTLLFARNSVSKGFLATTNMSEEQIRETDLFKRIAGLESGEGCTVTISADMYRFIRWVVKRDNPESRFRTIKLGNDVLSISRIK